jgi:hypothetical protein
MNGEQFKEFNDFLNGISEEEILAKNKEQLAKDDLDFEQLKTNLQSGRCYYCGQLIAHFSEEKPCFHWLLKPPGFKKKHFPLLYKDLGFHQIESYCRWVANCDTPMKNINDLVEEKSSSKFIEETIRYKNIEWSFSCSFSDRVGHKDRYEGRRPHYHFQMKANDNVVINYNGFHIPFTDYDEFCFAVKQGKLDRVKAQQIHGAGMQNIFEGIEPKDLIDVMKKSDNEDEAQFDLGILITADEGTTISGEQIADLLKERERTGDSIAKLIKEVKNVSAKTIIYPGKGVPKIAARDKNRGKKNGQSENETD